MAEVLKMEIEGAILKKLKSADTFTRGIFQDAMRDASTVVMEASIREAPAATGNLRKAITREFSDSGLKAEIFSSVVYGEMLHGRFDESDGEFTDPHMIPAREAKPGGTLYRWGQKRGMNPWAVRASIAKKGVRRNRFFKRAANATESAVGKVFEGAMDKLAKKLGD